jgi:N-methylhydantoinase A
VILSSDNFDDAAIEQWKSDFHSFYERAYGYSAPETPIEVTTMTITATGELGKLPLTPIERGDATPPEGALVMHSDVCLDGRTTRSIPFYHRSTLLAGNVVDGPAVIDDGLSTVLVPDDCRATVDRFGNVLIDVEQSAGGSV